MTTKIYSVDPDSDVTEASQIMCDWQIKRVPVVEKEVIVGIITLGDLAQANNFSNADVGDTVQKICSCEGLTKNNK